MQLTPYVLYVQGIKMKLFVATSALMFHITNIMFDNNIYKVITYRKIYRSITIWESEHVHATFWSKLFCSSLKPTLLNNPP